MPARNRRTQRAFVWLPRTGNAWILKRSIEINGEDVTIDVISSSFKKALCPDIAEFSVQLINADSAYTDRYDQNQTVEVFMDFVDGTTKRFSAKIDSIKNDYNQGIPFALNISGGQSELMRTINRKYTGNLTVQEILTQITGDIDDIFTINFTSTSTAKPTLTWDGKPYWDCVNDLRLEAGADAYLDEERVVQFFDSGSIINDDEAIVFNDTMINTDGLGKQIITEKNKITVLGDDGDGLPVIDVADDLASQGPDGIRDLVIFDSKINDTVSAQEVGLAKLNELSASNANTEGDVEALMLPSSQPGDMSYITNPVMKINGRFKIYAITHKLPSERTFCTVFKERKTKQLFKKQKERELAGQKLVNPFNMTSSINMPFNSTSELSSFDNNVQIVDGLIKLSSGTQGVFNSQPRTFNENKTQVFIDFIGTNVTLSTFQVVVDGEVQIISPKQLVTLDTPGKTILLRTILQSDTTEINSLALLIK